ncbi:MAG TPA: hypothetical protein VGQ83_41320, partial [Polyangia bacterium]
MRVVAGNRVHDLDGRDAPRGAPRPFDEPLFGIELDAAWDDLLAAYVDAGRLVLERLALDGRRGRTGLARDGADITHVAIAGAPGGGRLVAFPRRGKTPAIVLVPAAVPALGPAPPADLGTDC